MKLKNILICLFALALISCESNNPNINEDATFESGHFSISSTQKVQFSQGNLQYNATSNQWRFANKQYEVIGCDASKQISLIDGFKDLFSRDEYNNINYGNIMDGCWNELTIPQWHYILFERENAINLRAGASIDFGDAKCINGMILLPDEWNRPQSVSYNSTIINVYSLKEFREMEKSGAIFFPFTGTPRFFTDKGHGGHGSSRRNNGGAIYWANPSGMEVYFYNNNQFVLWLLEYEFYEDAIKESNKVAISEDSYAAIRLVKCTN